MKRLVVSLLLAAASVPGFAQTLAPSSSFSIDAKEVASRRKIDRKWQTDYGSYNRDFARTRTLSIEVKNFSRLPAGECKAQVYWIARNLATREPFIHDAGTINLNPDPRGGYTHECKELASNVTNYAALGERYVSGAKLDGWVVFLTRGDEVLTMRASSENYAKLIQDKAKREELLATTPKNNVLHQVQFRWN